VGRRSAAGRLPELWDRALLAYGRLMPYHPRKWRVVGWLAPRAAATWTSPRIAQRRGVWFELDLHQFVDRFIYYLEYERWETLFVERFVRPGWVVIDVGANIGYFTLLLARKVGPTGQVYAFEPAAAITASLLRNIDLNRASNVQTYRAALAAQRGETSLRRGRPDNLGQTHLAVPGDPGDELTPVTTLDAFVEEHGLTRLDFVKVDIEGAEAAFLAGAACTLARFRPTIMIELNPTALRALGANPTDLVRTLEGLGYVLKKTTWRGLRPLRALPAPGHYVNIVALPSGSQVAR